MAALAWAVEGATKRGQSITWAAESGAVVDLTGATITGVIGGKSIAARAIAGTMVSAAPTTGVFVWTYHVDDVADEGNYVVQFSATYGDGRIERTKPQEWTVYREVV